MELWVALLIWLIVFIVIFVVAKKYRVTTWSSIALATLISVLILGLLRPPNTLIMAQGSNWGSIYWLIMFIAPILIIIYTISKAITDRPTAGDRPMVY
jgi:ABC-type uncharacterized transport system permease subunit